MMAEKIIGVLLTNVTDNTVITNYEIDWVLDSYVHDNFGQFIQVKSIRIFGDSSFWLYGDDGPIAYDRTKPLEYWSVDSQTDVR